MLKYKFLVSSGTVPEPADKSIRSHAIRTALQNKPKSGVVYGNTDYRESQVASSQQSSRLIVEAKANLKGRFKVRIQPRKVPKTRLGQQSHAADDNAELNAVGTLDRSWEARSVVSYSIGGGGQSDPFHSIPIDHNPRADRLLKYFSVYFNLNKATVDPHRTWFGLAISDPVIMHTTLTLSGCSWLVSKTSQSDHDWIRHEMLRQKGRGIQAINDQLARSNITNTLFAAVACLANAACFEGAFHEADMHMQALRRLAGLRGGFSSFQDDFLTARAVTWSDIQTATALERLPFFPLNYSEIEDLFPEGLSNNGELQGLENLRLIGRNDDQIVAAFSLLTRAIVAKDQGLSPSHVRVLMVVAEHKLLDSLVSRGDAPQQYSVARALLTAAHLFLYLVLRHYPIKGPVVLALAKRLQGVIEGASREVFAQIHTYAIVWILFVGFLSESQLGDTQQHELWFSPRLYTTCHILDLGNKQDVEDILRMFLFEGDACVKGLHQLWDVVGSSSRLIEL